MQLYIPWFSTAANPCHLSMFVCSAGPTFTALNSFRYSGTEEEYTNAGISECIERTKKKSFQASVFSTNHTGLASGSEEESIYKIPVGLF